MAYYNKIDLYNDPRQIILTKMQAIDIDNEPEMNEFESSFLCGLLKEKKPKKIVEIGVAAGGTTAILLQCLEMLENDCRMYSIDCLEYFYADKSKKTGFMGEEAKKNIGGTGRCKHTFLLGISANLLNDIGPGIDFLILDTSHTLPGELLEFITCLPYLEDDAIVVLHDINLQHLGHINDNPELQ